MINSFDFLKYYLVSEYLAKKINLNYLNFTTAITITTIIVVKLSQFNYFVTIFSYLFL